MNTVHCSLFRVALSLALCAALAACSSSDSPGTTPQPEQDASQESQPPDAAPDNVSPEAGLDGVAEEASAGEDVAPQDAPAESDGATCKLIKKYSSSNPTCNDCAEQKCCVEINACLGDLECDDTYVNCILACALMPEDAGDAGIALCMDECAAQAPKGKAEYDAAIGCADSKCKTECL
ncbi:MAG: hypothetical protein HY898_02995 [Deltaproteobacteria bacterium]|nr:hypothetical protein [Deltaproteobacteria bacterium]